jgi:hypothetical protein
MAQTNLQASRALKVVPNDSINIPHPAGKLATGTTTGVGTTANDVQDSAATFTDGSIKVGDIVYNVADAAIHTISAIVDDNNLTLTAGSIGTGKAYTIYSVAPDRIGKDCKIYVGVAGDVTVETAAGDVETFTAVPAGTYMPVMVKRVNSTATTATNLVALW